MKTSNITNDVVTNYIYSMYRPLSGELEKLRREAEEDEIPVILPDTEELILAIARLKRPENILEIGTAAGYSALCFAEAIPDAKIVTLEKSEDMAQLASKNIEAAGRSHQIEVICCDAADPDVYDRIMDKYGNDFDLVFIDAAKSHYDKFWENSIPLCRKGAVILSDNVLMKGATASDIYDPKGRFKTSIRKMRKYLEKINDTEGVTTSVFSVGDGLAVSVLEEFTGEDL